MNLITKDQAYEILKRHEHKRLEQRLSGAKITDTFSDSGIYLPAKDDEYWYCLPGEDSLTRIGGSRVVVISKSTGEIVFDAYCGD